jgi:DNA-directed RNA polymerase subunit RPC12/RpoP
MKYKLSRKKLADRLQSFYYADKKEGDFINDLLADKPECTCNEMSNHGLWCPVHGKEFSKAHKPCKHNFKYNGGLEMKCSKCGKIISQDKLKKESICKRCGKDIMKPGEIHIMGTVCRCPTPLKTKPEIDMPQKLDLKLLDNKRVIDIEIVLAINTIIDYLTDKEEKNG